MNRQRPRALALRLSLILLAAIPLTLGSCSWRTVRRTIQLSRDMKHETFIPPEEEGPYEIILENLSFVSSRNVDVEIIASEDTRVEVDYSEGLERYGFAVTFDDDVLRVGTDSPRSFSTTAFVMTVYAPYDRISLSGGMPLKVDANGLDSLSVDVRGASDIRIQALDASAVDIELEGAGAFDLTGRTDHLSVDLEGAGSVDAKQLISSIADVSIDGAGSVELSVSEVLDVEINGLGSIAYYGSPEVNRSGGLGSLDQKDEQPWGG